MIGSGGQGEVYRADLQGRTVALKWYYEDSATGAQRDGLEALLRKGSPAPRFLWPIDLAYARGVAGYG